MLTRVVLGCLLVIVTACGGPSTSSIPTGRPSPTPDPAVAQVKATVEAYMAADFQSGLSGDATAAEQFVFPDATAARSAATIDASVARDSGHSAEVLDVQFTNWAVDVSSGTASVDVLVAGHLQPVTWPAKAIEGPVRNFGPERHHFGLIQSGLQWLLTDIS